MIKCTLGEIAALCQGRTDRPEVAVAGVSTDSRRLEPGNLFIPLSGERVDGHQFLPQALARGAAAAFWDESRGESPSDLPLVKVDSPLLALQRLAQAYRRQLPVRIVAVTGSNGKTSVKEMLIAILSTAFRTGGTPGNLNSEVGVPLSLLGLDRQLEWAVIEMGMSGAGEIALLSQMASPDLAVITNVGPAHLADLGSLAAIAAAKLEVLQGLRPGGRLVADGECPWLRPAVTASRAITFGDGQQNDFHPLAVEQSGEVTRFWVNQAPDQEFCLQLIGRHQVMNALAAIAVARELGLAWPQIARGLAEVRRYRQRGELLRRGRLTIIDDSYKSNPPSAVAALRALYSLSGYGRRMAVLGDMRDLGAEEQHWHQVVGELLDPGLLDTVITVGPAASRIAAAAADRWPADRLFALPSPQGALEILRQRIADQPALVLVKGARALGLDQLVRALEEAFPC